jgi:hypothetical protein
MIKNFYSKKKRVLHPLSCWDIISYQFSILPCRWDLEALEKKKLELSWNINFDSIQMNQRHAFLVVDTCHRICYKSRNFNKFLRCFLQQSLSFSYDQILTHWISGLLINNRVGESIHAGFVTITAKQHSVKIFPLLTRKKVITHFFILACPLS